VGYQRQKSFSGKRRYNISSLYRKVLQFLFKINFDAVNI